MGNQASREKHLEEYLNRFNDQERNTLRNVYLKITKDEKTTANIPQKPLHVEDLTIYVENKLPEGELTKRFYGVMSHLSGGTGTVTYSGFVKTLAYILKGDIDESQDVYSNFIPFQDQSVSIVHFKEFLEQIAQHFVNILKVTKQHKSWNFDSNGSDIFARMAQLLFHDFSHRVKDSSELWNSPETKFDKEQISNWFRRESLLTNVFCIIFKTAFLNEHSDLKLLPISSGANWSRLTSILDVSSLLLINNHLPPHLQTSWHLLYSSGMHGASFSTLLGHILKKGPTVIVVKDKEGHIFGGFSSVSWDFKPTFTGTENCFLFKLSPHLAVYSSSGYNTNYVYLCLHQHTLPNGLGFGGQLNNFGLWIDAEFDHGHSTPACATYQSPLLSGSRQYQVDTVEVWRVGPEIDSLKEGKALPKMSCLDSDVTATAIMTIANKIGASDGLREAGVEGE